MMLHIQKLPRISIGLKMRDKNIPIVYGNIIRSIPPQKFMLSIVQPTPNEPVCATSAMVNHARIIPRQVVIMPKMRVDSR